MVGVAQLVEPRIVIPVVVGSSPIVHPIMAAKLDYIFHLCEGGGIGRRAGFRFQWGNTRESSSLSLRTIFLNFLFLYSGLLADL